MDVAFLIASSVAASQRPLRPPTSRPSDDVANGRVTRELPVASALPFRRVIAQKLPLEAYPTSTPLRPALPAPNTLAEAEATDHPNRSHAACRLTPKASPIRCQLTSRSRSSSTFCCKTSPVPACAAWARGKLARSSSSVRLVQSANPSVGVPARIEVQTPTQEPQICVPGEAPPAMSEVTSFAVLPQKLQTNLLRSSFDFPRAHPPWCQDVPDTEELSSLS